jgi:hypothetical protein
MNSLSAISSNQLTNIAIYVVILVVIWLVLRLVLRIAHRIFVFGCGAILVQIGRASCRERVYENV